MVSTMSTTAKPVVFSGAQPTSDSLHLGNALGAVAQWVGLQDGHDAYFCVVDLHAITIAQEPETLRKRTLVTAAQYLALGIDPQRATVFVQSHVPAHAELAWVLGCFTGFGQASRMTQFKDKSQKQGAEATTVGLFTYPVLMAADILAYDADIVPVGEDQVQHIEVTRDLAGSFNHQFGETFVLPKAKVLESSAKVPGADGQKMSKSYGNTIEIFEDTKKQRKQIMRMPTDSRPMEDAKDPDTDHLYQLFSLFAPDEEREEMAAMYRRGGFGYGDVKKSLAEAAENFFGEARERRQELEANPKKVMEILGDGASRARKKAGDVLHRAQQACGLKR